MFYVKCETPTQGQGCNYIYARQPRLTSQWVVIKNYKLFLILLLTSSLPDSFCPTQVLHVLLWDVDLCYLAKP